MRKKLAQFLPTLSLGLGFGLSSLLAQQPLPSGGPLTPQRPSTGQTPSPMPGTSVPSPSVTDGSMAPSGDSGLGAEATAGGAGGGGGSAGAAPMAGRADSLNRFNLFDTQAAAPRTRVWFAYQTMTNFSPGNAQANPFVTHSSNPLLQSSTNPFTVPSGQIGSSGFTTKQYLYRVGVELALSERFSIAAQHQYIADPNLENSWGNPQFMAKYALIYTDNAIVSAILGVQPQTSISDNEVRDRATRIYPGALFYYGVGDCQRLFFQGGFQFGLPINSNDPQTFDLAFSVGYWVYKNPDADAFFQGIVPQAEIFGKHVINDATIANGFGTGASGFGGPGVNFDEERNVYDVTLGAQLVFKHFNVGAAYSFPITGAEVRRDEFGSFIQFRW